MIHCSEQKIAQFCAHDWTNELEYVSTQSGQFETFSSNHFSVQYNLAWALSTHVCKFLRSVVDAKLRNFLFALPHTSHNSQLHVALLNYSTYGPMRCGAYGPMRFFFVQNMSRITNGCTWSDAMRCNTSRCIWSDAMRCIWSDASLSTNNDSIIWVTADAMRCIWYDAARSTYKKWRNFAPTIERKCWHTWVLKFRANLTHALKSFQRSCKLGLNLSTHVWKLFRSLSNFHRVRVSREHRWHDATRSVVRALLRASLCHSQCRAHLTSNDLGRNTRHNIMKIDIRDYEFRAMWETTFPRNSQAGLGRPFYEPNIRLSMSASP